MSASQWVLAVLLFLAIFVGMPFNIWLLWTILFGKRDRSDG